MMTIYVERIERIKEGAHLTQEDVGKIVGASPRTVARWAAGENMPRGASRQRLLELAAIAQQIANVMKPDAAGAWLYEPNPLLKNQKPADLVAQGRYQEVLDLVDALADGVFV